MKTYKNLDDLIFELKNKGVTINDDKYAKNILEKYGYYSIVNSYKDIFKDNKGNYKKGVTFEEIVALFQFDLSIRHIFLKFIFEIEYKIKTSISELLCENYGLNDYLKVNNFDNNINSNIIKNMINIITEEINKQKDNHQAINHFYYTYGFIPPYVLVKILTLGQISKLYNILKQQDRQKISKQFGVSDKELMQIIKNITLVRNICCHNDRLFSYHSKFYLPLKKIHPNYKRGSTYSTNMFLILKSIQFILKSDSLETLIYQEIYKLKDNIKSVNIKLVLNLMGIPDTLKKYKIYDIDENGTIKIYDKFLYRNKVLSTKTKIKILSEYFYETIQNFDEKFNNLKISSII